MPAASLTVTLLIVYDGIASLSLIVPVLVTPPILTISVSVFSYKESSLVITVTEKPVTVPGTVNIPPANVTVPKPPVVVKVGVAL